MSREKEQKINKLRRTKIWPSVLFFIFSLIIAVALVSGFMAMMLTYVIQSKLTDAYNKSADVGQFIEHRIESGETFETAIGKLNGTVNAPQAVNGFDKSDSHIGGFGGKTYILEKEHNIIEDDLSDKYKIYDDENNIDSIVAADGDIALSVGEIFGLTFFGGSKNFDDAEWIEEKIVSADYWNRVPVGSDGNYVLVKNTISILRNDMIYTFGGGILALVLILIPLIFLFINLVSNIKSQRQMSKLVYTDPVTGGYNKLYFEHQARRMLTKITFSSEDKFAIVDLTMRKYRNYCACHGTAEGENLLEKLDEILNMNINKKWEVAAHSSYGTYALLLRCHNSIPLEDRIMEIIYALRSADLHHRLVFDVGVNVIDPAYTEFGKKIKKKDINILQCYENASIARYTLRGDEDGGIAFFDDELIEKQRWEHTVEIKMNDALKNEEFAVYLQPKYNPVTGKLAGAEALIRWISPEEGFVPPGKFIPIFERNGFITRIDDYMISHVAKLQAEWIAQGKEVVPISVNVSRAHFSQSDLAENICRLVDAYNTPHNVIEIELTESAFFDDKAALLATVNKLKKYGFEISMDDFGAGYSSLNSLKDLPLDVLKLDAEFFRGDDFEGRGEVVVAQAINLAKQLKMRIVAEGIEKKEQVDFLAELGCDMIQGYYFAKPMPVEEYEARAFG